MAHLIDKDALVAEIKKRIKETESMQPKFDQFLAGQISAFKGILKILDTIEVKEVDKEPVSEDLEEAAMQYAKLKHKDFALQEIVSWDLKAGVKWQKEQLKANTVDATIGLPYENKDGGYTQLIDVSRPLPVGKNKIAIIFKEVQ